MCLAWGNSLLPKLCQVISKTDSQANRLEESITEQSISSNHILMDLFPGLSPASHLSSIQHPGKSSYNINPVMIRMILPLMMFHCIKWNHWSKMKINNYTDWSNTENKTETPCLSGNVWARPHLFSLFSHVEIFTCHGFQFLSLMVTHNKKYMLQHYPGFTHISKCNVLLVLIGTLLPERGFFNQPVQTVSMPPLMLCHCILFGFFAALSIIWSSRFTFILEIPSSDLI